LTDVSEEQSASTCLSSPCSLHSRFLVSALHCLRPLLLSDSTSTSHWSLVLLSSCLFPSPLLKIQPFSEPTLVSFPLIHISSPGFFSGLYLDQVFPTWLTQLAACVAYPLTLNIKAVCYFKTLVNNTTQHHSLEDITLYV
jgi:hypothetical protein